MARKSHNTAIADTHADYADTAEHADTPDTATEASGASGGIPMHPTLVEDVAPSIFAGAFVTIHDGSTMPLSALPFHALHNLVQAGINKNNADAVGGTKKAMKSELSENGQCIHSAEAIEDACVKSKSLRWEKVLANETSSRQRLSAFDAMVRDVANEKMAAIAKAQTPPKKLPESAKELTVLREKMLSNEKFRAMVEEEADRRLGSTVNGEDFGDLLGG